MRKLENNAVEVPHEPVDEVKRAQNLRLVKTDHATGEAFSCMSRKGA